MNIEEYLNAIEQKYANDKERCRIVWECSCLDPALLRELSDQKDDNLFKPPLLIKNIKEALSIKCEKVNAPSELSLMLLDILKNSEASLFAWIDEMSMTGEKHPATWAEASSFVSRLLCGEICGKLSVAQDHPSFIDAMEKLQEYLAHHSPEELYWRDAWSVQRKLLKEVAETEL